MAKLINEIGNKYGFLTVLEKVPSPKPKDTHAYYRCKCDCGSETIVSADKLRNKETSSCGCKRRIKHHAHDLSLIGKKFGKLTIKEPGKYENNKYYWICECMCGNIIETCQDNLKQGKSTQCQECAHKSRAQKRKKFINPGDVFGRWTVLKRAPSPEDGKAMYTCRCECGEIRDVYGYNLRRGVSKSCGCFRKELYTDTSIIGKKFKMLTVLDIVKTENCRKYVKCRCECGREKIFRFDLIMRNISDATISCGCLGSSYGEKEISKILDKLDLTYSKEYIFSDLLNEEQTRNLRFDFAVKSKNGKKLYFLIEYDGIQHTQEIPYFQTPLEEIQKKDQMKNDYCTKNNIPLLRISYKDFDNMEQIIRNYINTNFNFLIKEK